jgi:predicted PurR-regulated permease PerM
LSRRTGAARTSERREVTSGPAANVRRMTAVNARAVLRTVMIVVAVVLILYLIYLLRHPIGLLAVATFIAIALSGPVNVLQRRMRRGFAITVVYIGLLLVPIGLAALVLPPVVTQVESFATNAPKYATDVRDYIEKNKTLRGLQEKYDIGGQLQKKASELPARIGDAATVLGNIGLGIVNSVFQLVTILILAAFMLGSGRRWVDAWLAYQPPHHAARLRRILDRISTAVGSYVAGALLQAIIAGSTSYLVMLILGVPFRGPLAVIIGLLDLIPLVGATIGAIIVGVVTLFVNFPTATIVWVVWSIVYQQVENSVIQPRIQQRAVDVQPFVILVAVLFGSTLLGVTGALVAVPAAASLQITLREWLRYRADSRIMESVDSLDPATGHA